MHRLEARRGSRYVALALLLATGAASAQNVSPLRPQEPVTITSSSFEGAESGIQVLSGNVRLISGSLELTGDRAELRQAANGQFTITISGAPGRIDHAGDPSARNPPQPPISAEARTLVYDSATRLIELTGAARLTRGGDEITSDTIRYDVAERRVRAQGGESGQVRVVIQPDSDLIERAQEQAPEATPRKPAANPPAAPDSPP